MPCVTDLSVFKSLVGNFFRAGHSAIHAPEEATCAPSDESILELKKVTELDEEEYTGVSLIFHGPADKFLPQKTYTLSCDALGEFDVFLVPVGELREKRDGRRERTGFIYQAVFTRLREEI